jgi:hypothetical protein
MKGRFRSLTVAAAALATVGIGLLAGGGTALAAGGGGPTPPWESSISPAPFGSITFYNAQGQVVTGGSITANGLGAYAVASTAVPAGYTKASLFVYTPVSGTNPALWSGSQIGAATTFPNASAPVPIGGATPTANPVKTNPGTDQTLAGYIAGNPNTQTAAGYVGLYDVRLQATGVGQPALASYWDTVISVNTTTNTWSVDWPDWTKNTTTTLTASPPSPQTAPASPITLTATVSPATAGTVSFWSGYGTSSVTQVGTTKTVTTTSGTASVTTTPPTGTTVYTAVFTPTVGSIDIGSASTPLSYVVGGTPGPPVWEPVLFGPNRVGGVDSCLAAFQGATTVTYAWQANGTAISGVTTSTYKVPASLLGQTLTCSVTATNSAGSVSGTSAGAKIGLGLPLVPVVKPVLSGPHLPGRAEKVTAGTWSPAASKVTYQWYLGSTKVAGATKSSFTVPSSARGKTVHCVVTASATGYANGTYTTPSVRIT